MTVLFDVFGKILNPSTSLFVTFHRCMSSNNICMAVFTQCMFRLFKNDLFPERVSNIVFLIRKWCLKIFELNRHISGSTQNNPSKISTHEAVRTISLIKSNLLLSLLLLISHLS